MTVMFDRKVFFDSVRKTLFDGKMSQQQVDGLNFKLDMWEKHHTDWDLRWLGYPLATSKHETASKMWPIEEYGKGEGQPYGKINPTTGFAYYGRGDVQLTWDYNYQNASARLKLDGTEYDLYWHPDKALEPRISAEVMFNGMDQGWFRPPHNLAKYFHDEVDDPYGAREIINGDKTRVPDWSNGVSIGNLIKGYYMKFMAALNASLIKEPPAPPEPEPGTKVVASLTVKLKITVLDDGSAEVSDSEVYVDVVNEP